MTTVKELIDELKKYPEDMIVATDFQPNWDITPIIRTWTPSNYPYDRDEYKYLNLE